MWIRTARGLDGAVAMWAVGNVDSDARKTPASAGYARQRRGPTASAWSIPLGRHRWWGAAGSFRQRNWYIEGPGVACTWMGPQQPPVAPRSLQDGGASWVPSKAMEWRSPAVPGSPQHAQLRSRPSSAKTVPNKPPPRRPWLRPAARRPASTRAAAALGLEKGLVFY